MRKDRRISARGIYGAYREGITIWNVMIPIDQPRGDYIENCMNTETVSVVSRYGEVLHDVPIPDYLLDRVEFPQPGKLGSEVVISFVHEDRNHYPYVVAARKLRNNFRHNKEHTMRLEKRTENSGAEILLRGDKGQVIIGVNSSETEGGKMILNITNSEGNAELQVNVRGAVNINAPTINQVARELISDTLSLNKEAKDADGNYLNEDDYKSVFKKTLKGFEVAITKGDDVATNLKYESGVGFEYSDEFGNKILADSEQVQIISSAEVVKLGEGAEKMVLGDTLAGLLKDIIAEVAKSTTSAGPLLNAAAIAAFSAQVDSILSQYSKTD